MKFQPGFEDYFLSPVSGRILESGLPNLENNYIFIGSRSKRPIQSPAIIDIRLELAKLRFRLRDTKFIIQSAHEGFNNAQALDELDDGIMKNIKGVVHIAVAGTDYMAPSLTKGKIWIGDDDNKPAEKQTIDIKNLPDLTKKNIWIGDDDNRPEIKATIYIDNLPNLSENKIWVGDSNDRPVESDHLPAGALPNLTKNNLWRGDNDNRPEEITRIGLTNLPTLTNKHLWIGNDSDIPVEAQTITIDNLPDLTSGNIWRGNSLNRPEETADLSNLENRVTDLEHRVTDLETRVTTIEADIVEIQGEIAAIQAELVAIQTEIEAIQVQITGILASIAALQLQITALDGRLTALENIVHNLRLDTFVIGGPPDSTGLIHTSRGPTCLLTNIPAGGDVDLGNYRIFNLQTFSASTWEEMEAKEQDAINFLFLWQLLGGGTR